MALNKGVLDMTIEIPEIKSMVPLIAGKSVLVLQNELVRNHIADTFIALIFTY